MEIPLTEVQNIISTSVIVLPQKIQEISSCDILNEFLLNYKDTAFGVFNLIDEVEMSYEALTNAYEYLMQITQTQEIDPAITSEIAGQLQAQYDNAINAYIDYNNPNLVKETVVDEKKLLGIFNTVKKYGIKTTLGFILVALVIVTLFYIYSPIKKVEPITV